MEPTTETHTKLARVDDHFDRVDDARRKNNATRNILLAVTITVLVVLNVAWLLFDVTAWLALICPAVLAWEAWMRNRATNRYRRRTQGTWTECRAAWAAQLTEKTTDT